MGQRGTRRKGKERKSIYSAFLHQDTHKAIRHHTVLPANTMPAFPSWRSPDVTTTTTEAADIQLQLTTHLSTQKYERLSWPSWYTYSGWLTHVSGHPSATTRAQDSESTSAKDQCSTAGPRNQQGEGRACPLPTARNLAPALHVSTYCGVSRMPYSMRTAIMMKHHTRVVRIYWLPLTALFD